MKTCLMIMNARDIPECGLSLKALQIDKVWFRGFTEKQLEEKITGFIESTDYDYYVLVSDDVIATQQALDNLLENQGAAPVVTGWCNIFPGEPTIANLELAPATPENSAYIRWRDRIPRFALPMVKKLYVRFLASSSFDPVYHHFPGIDKIWSQKPLFRTYFVGWALTSMRRDYWLKYGFRMPKEFSQRAGHGSDRAMSDDLAKDDVIALCARDSFVYHLASLRNFIVGRVEPRVIFEPLNVVSDERMGAND